MASPIQWKGRATDRRAETVVIVAAATVVPVANATELWCRERD
jgi:hypothetical protein